MVKFKSIPAIFFKERTGIKPNTVRKVDEFDDRFKKLYEGERIIVIENSESGEMFQRVITDITFWEDLVIISWKHESQLGGNKS